MAQTNSSETIKRVNIVAIYARKKSQINLQFKEFDQSTFIS